jgi:hypothetical protein
VTVKVAVLSVGRSDMFRWRFRLARRGRHDRKMDFESKRHDIYRTLW